MKRRELLRKGAKATWVTPTIIGVSIPLHAQATTPECPPYFNDTYILVELIHFDPLLDFPSGLTVTFTCPAFSITKTIDNNSKIPPPPPPHSERVELTARDLNYSVQYQGAVKVTIEHPEIVDMTKTVGITTELDECGIADTQYISFNLEPA